MKAFSLRAKAFMYMDTCYIILGDTDIDSDICQYLLICY